VVSQVGSAPEGNALPEVPVVLKLLGTQGVLLRPKLTAEARIMTGITNPVQAVPLTAIANAEGESKVWILGWGNRLRSRRIEVGRANPDYIEVTQGLTIGERVVQTAEPDYVEGERVIVSTSPAHSTARTRALIQKAQGGKKPEAASPLGRTGAGRKAQERRGSSF
jgi:hypothetical protein